MNDTDNGKFRYFIIFSRMFMFGLLAAPVTAQEKPADEAVTPEGPYTTEAEAPELTEEAEKAIERGLKFLISSQNKDGSWSSKDVEKGEGSGYAIGGTSLGLMAFMVEGHFPGFGQYGKALERAKNYLLKRAEESPTGAMGVKMYEIGLFTIAMSELWGMTSDPKDNKEIQVALERVVEIILRSQNPLGVGDTHRDRMPDRTPPSQPWSSSPLHQLAKRVSWFRPKQSNELPTTFAIKPLTSGEGDLVIKAKAIPSHALPGVSMPLNWLVTGGANGYRPLSIPWRTIQKCSREKTTGTSIIPIIMRCRPWFRLARTATPSGIPRFETLLSPCSNPTGRGRKRRRITLIKRPWPLSY